jgi:imidazolonepropionase-like amidohydrolase
MTFISVRTSASVALLAFLGAFSASVASAQETRTLSYVVLSNGQPAGMEVDKYAPRGLIDSQFEFNDRGRGPKTTAHYEFGADGLPLKVDVKGVNYLKAPVDEHFAATATTSAWHSEGEHGESPTRGFYLTTDGTSTIELAALARALSHAKTGTIGLLPGGEARVEILADTVVESHGQKMHVREAALTGLDFVPVAVWIDDQGDFFAMPGTWFAILRSGWESVNGTLFKLQSDAEDARYARLARTLSRHPAHALAIEHVGVFDSEHATLLADQTVIVDGERIASVGPSDKAQPPTDAERIDGHGKTLLPGLFDMHMHVQPPDGLLNIASGVTAGRDVGNDIERLARIQQLWQTGEAIGPQFWKAGLIDGPGPYQAPTGIFVDDAASAEAAVNKYADLGYVQIKLYSSLKPELMPLIATVAHRRGLRVSGHIPNGMIAADFVKNGADELQHINFIFLNFLAAKVKDTRTPERFTAVGENAALLDLNSPEVNQFVNLLVEHHTTLDITLATFEGMFNGRPGKVAPDFVPIIDRLPAQVRRQALSEGLPVTAENDQRYKDSWVALLKMTKKLFDAGVPILAGTDAMAGVMLHRELELEVQAGIPAAKALQNATWLAASVLKQEATIGSIRPGKRADLLLVEGDPTQHISDIRRGRLVLKGGVVFEPAKLYSAIGMGPSR